MTRLLALPVVRLLPVLTMLAAGPAAGRTPHSGAAGGAGDDARLVELMTRGCGGTEDEARLGCFDRAGQGSAAFRRALRALGVGCAANRDPAGRLTCWDRIAAALPAPDEDAARAGVPAAPPVAAVPVGGGGPGAPVPDAPLPGVLLFADTVSGSPAVASLFLRCQDGAPEVTFSPAHLIPGRDYPVSVQVGGGPVVSDTWAVTPNGMLLAAPAPASLIEAAESADRAVLRVPLPGEGAVTATFDVRGLREAMAPVRRACGWG